MTPATGSLTDGGGASRDSGSRPSTKSAAPAAENRRAGGRPRAPTTPAAIKTKVRHPALRLPRLSSEGIDPQTSDEPRRENAGARMHANAKKPLTTNSDGRDRDERIAVIAQSVLRTVRAILISMNRDYERCGKSACARSRRCRGFACEAPADSRAR